MLMDQFTKESGNLASLVGKEHCTFKMAQNTQGLGLMESIMDMEFMSQKVKQSMMECGIRASTKEKGDLIGQMARIIRDLGLNVRKMVLESSLEQMESSMKENGLMESMMDSVH